MYEICFCACVNAALWQKNFVRMRNYVFCKGIGACYFVLILHFEFRKTAAGRTEHAVALKTYRQTSDDKSCSVWGFQRFC